MRHLLGTNGMSAAQIYRLLDRARWWQEHGHRCYPLQGKVVANLFFEPSTRTNLSFALAAQKLGAHVLQFHAEGSSLAKGESVLDTAQTLEAMGADVLVIRHSSDTILNELLPHVSASIVNAGTGRSEHPTQALLDLYTIRKHFGRLSGLTVCIAGDIKHSRVAMSNLWALTACGAKVVFAGPPQLLPDNIHQLGEVVSLDEVIDQVDVVMMLRIQLERHTERLGLSKQEYHAAYGLTEERAARIRPDGIIMHPGPVNRGVELAPQLVTHPKSKILEQVHNGVFVRMAVLEAVAAEESKLLHLQHSAG